MADKASRKQAMDAYKEREVVGGLYRIVNTQTGWQSELFATQNLEGQRNRYQFAKDTNTCFDLALKEQWAQYGADAFRFVEVESIAKKPEQSMEDFKEELKALLAMANGE